MLSQISEIFCLDFFDFHYFDVLGLAVCSLSLFILSKWCLDLSCDLFQIFPVFHLMQLTRYLFCLLSPAGRLHGSDG